MLRSARNVSTPVAAGTLVVGVAMAAIGVSCTPDFDALDPSLGGSSGNGGAGAGGSGAANTGATNTGGSGAGTACDPIIDGDDCTEDTCQNGEPVNPQKAPGAACNQGGGAVCDASGACIGCFADEHCSLPETCGGGGAAETCGCTPSTCASLGATCGMVSDGCGDMLNCNNAAMDGDETAVDCGGDPGTCATRCAIGSACGDQNDCVAGDFCADQICCTSACAATCKSCSLPGNEGDCVDVPLQGVDPGTCVAPDACNGDGGCKLANGQPCNGNGGCASGNCDANVCAP